MEFSDPRVVFQQNVVPSSHLFGFVACVKQILLSLSREASLTQKNNNQAKLHIATYLCYRHIGYPDQFVDLLALMTKREVRLDIPWRVVLSNPENHTAS